MRSLSPLDGRYSLYVDPLRLYFSEEALHWARVLVELRYLQALASEPAVRELPKIKRRQVQALERIIERFGDRDVDAIRKIERRTNHDVKAVEYYLREKVARISGLRKHAEFIHFGLTSDDVNNLAYGLLIGGALKQVIRPALKSVHGDLVRCGRLWGSVELLSLTHGQPATPTTVGKEFMVFADRLDRQLQQLKGFKMNGKFGGAVGNYSAHEAAYPHVKWEAFGRKFVRSLGLQPLKHTTQINPHDDVAELSHLMVRINTILLDLSRDVWLYIMRGVLKQKVVPGEVGSSTMPHKVNPIHFENAEGNLGLSSALFAHFAEKLPVSRMQRDLSDSTVQRNLGVAFGYHLLAVSVLQRGFARVAIDRNVITEELSDHPEVFAEAIQIVLRKNGVAGAYEKLKKLTRGERVTREELTAFIEKLDIAKGDRERLLSMVHGHA